MRRINGGLKIGRTWIGYRPPIRGRYAPRRIKLRSGGSRTPGPWWELVIPHLGSVIFNRDRTIFGFDDPDAGGAA